MSLQMKNLDEMLESMRRRGIVVLGLSINKELYDEFISLSKPTTQVDPRNAIPVNVVLGRHKEPWVVTHSIRNS